MPTETKPDPVVNFVYAVPNTAPQVKPALPIAILQPKTSGNLFAENVYTQAGPILKTRSHVLELLSAAQKDLERIIIAKGFPSAGTFTSIDEMTFSQKERSSLILSPSMEVSVAVADGGFGKPRLANVSGTVSLEFYEPMSKEKVWVKRVQLQPYVTEVASDQISLPEILAGKQVPVNTDAINERTMIELLNTFYATSMSKIWDQLDPREIQGLKGDADKLKAKTNYRG